MTDIMRWHRHKFPKANPISQKLHLQQEIEEFEKADLEHAIEELADIYIIANSFRRWQGYREFADQIKHYYYDQFGGITKIKINKAVENKIKVINKRNYFWNGVDYDRVRDE